MKTIAPLLRNARLSTPQPLNRRKQTAFCGFLFTDKTCRKKYVWALLFIWRVMRLEGNFPGFPYLLRQFFAHIGAGQPRHVHVGTDGLEPSASSMSRKRSASELRARILYLTTPVTSGQLPDAS